jgi:hypothetical protein
MILCRPLSPDAILTFSARRTVAVAAAAATKKPDGTFTAARIDFGRGDVLP